MIVNGGRWPGWEGGRGSLRVLDGDTWYQANMLPLSLLPNELLPRIVE